MRRKIFIFTMFVGAAFMFSCQKNAPKLKQPDVDLEESYHTRNDSVFVAGIWMYFIEEPQYHLTKARESMDNNNLKAAIYEIRRAATFFQLEEIHAKSKPGDALVAAREELENLADEMEAGKIPASKDMESVFSAQLYVLAKHYQNEAAQYVAKKQTLQTAYALKAGVMNLEKARSWTAKDSKNSKNIQSVAKIADGVIEGKHFTGTTLYKQVEVLKRELDQFEKNYPLLVSEKS